MKQNLLATSVFWKIKCGTINKVEVKGQVINPALFAI